MLRPMWWENGVFPPPHRRAFRRTGARRRAIFPCAISPTPSSLHTLFPHTRTPILARFSVQHPFSTAFFLYRIFSPHLFLFCILLNSCSYLDFLRLQFEPLSLCSHVLPTLLVSRTATNTALISCKCVNRVVSPHRQQYQLASEHLAKAKTQGIMGYFLYASNTSKWCIEVLHRLGLSISYTKRSFRRFGGMEKHH